MTTTTTLIHLPSDGPLEWWRDALVYEIAAPQLVPDAVLQARSMLDHVASLGMTAVLVRPSGLSPAEMDTRLAALITQAHGMGLKVIVRISGAMGPVTGSHAREANPVTVGREEIAEGLVARAGAVLDAGADGLDLGTIVPPEVTDETDLTRLSGYFARLQVLLADHVVDGVIGADVSASYPETLRHHLQEDWLHHLRDDSLVMTQWSAESIAQQIAHSLDEHDRFGAPPVWRYLPSYRVLDSTDPGDGTRWFEGSAEDLRRRSIALTALTLALPGAVYLRQGDEVAIPDRDRPEGALALADLVYDRAAVQGAEFGSPLATVRHAVLMRGEHSLATGPLAFVRGLPWCPDGALAMLARDLLVVVNTTDAPLDLPEHAEVVLASSPLHQVNGHLSVPPTTTVWLIAGTVA